MRWEIPSALLLYPIRLLEVCSLSPLNYHGERTSKFEFHLCECVCVCACVRACARVCVCVCVCVSVVSNNETCLGFFLNNCNFVISVKR